MPVLDWLIDRWFSGPGMIICTQAPTFTCDIECFSNCGRYCGVSRRSQPESN